MFLPFVYLSYRTGTINVDRMIGKLNILANRPREELRGVAARCFDRYVRGDIMPGAVELIRRHQNAADTVVLATSSLGLIVRPLAEELGIEHVLCTELEFRDGIATGRFARPPCLAEEKLRCVSEFVGLHGGTLQEVFFYSDSRLDMPLLESVGHPVAVNPDRGLKREARTRGWQIVKVS